MLIKGAPGFIAWAERKLITTESTWVKSYNLQLNTFDENPDQARP